MTSATPPSTPPPTPDPPGWVHDDPHIYTGVPGEPTGVCICSCRYCIGRYGCICPICPCDVEYENLDPTSPPFAPV